MPLSVGIVGLPNVGKSTLFKALTKKQVEISNRPFTTIKPNVAVVAVSDMRLEELKKIKITKEIVPATIEFIDIAGLVKNAHRGEGLGNQFLSHIKNTDAIIHVVRIFEDENISHIHNKVDPLYDIEVINQELKEANIEKSVIYLLNFNKEEKPGPDSTEKVKNLISKLPPDKTLMIDLKSEEELAELSEEEAIEFRADSVSPLEKVITLSYKALDLVTFFTIKGENQLRAWEIKRETQINEAAGKIHTDFKNKFIRAEVINWEKLVEVGSWQKAKEKGLIKTAGRDYIVQDGDVIEVKI